MDHGRAFVAELTSALSRDSIVITDPSIVIAYSRDQAPIAHSGIPIAVLLARSESDVAIALSVASAYQIPVVPRGAGSGLAGGANALDGSLVLSLEQMNAILEIDPIDRIARVEPGVVNLDLDEAVGEFGLSYLPDPASRDWCTIGGNVSTNAGGMCCLKYGVTSDHVIGLRVVLASGEVIRVGRRTLKGVTGLDLLHLFVGAEGTLGIITEITVRLADRPNLPATLVATFDSIESAAVAATAIRKNRTAPSLLEIIDRTTLAAVESWHPMGLANAGALVIAQFDTEIDMASQNAIAACLEHGATNAVASTDPADTADLLAARKMAYPALDRLGTALLDDVCVPLSKIADLVIGIEKIGEVNGLKIGIFGHAGDGNMHPTIVYDRGNEIEVAKVETAFEEIVVLAQSLGGTASGEHGIGSIKADAASAELGERVIEIQRAIKLVFDPDSIMNPGRKFSLF
jgi:glycolate oxidase